MNLKTIFFEEGFSKTDDYEFMFNKVLTEVVLPESLTSIGTGAFHGCTSLTTINIPGNVTTIIGIISDDAKDLIKGLLQVNTKKRLTAEQALEHKLFKNEKIKASQTCYIIKNSHI